MLLDQVQETKAAAQVATRNGHHQTQVALNQSLPSPLAVAGSVAGRVLRSATTPMLLVHPQPARLPTRQLAERVG